MELERRLLELGFVEGAEVEILHEGPLGRDPIAVRVNDYTIALRRREAMAILVSLIGTAMTTATEMTAWRFALVGTPNSGKTALFNALTGSRQKVANYPGVTVERKAGVFADGVGPPCRSARPAGHLFAARRAVPTRRSPATSCWGVSPARTRPICSSALRTPPTFGGAAAGASS